MAKEDKITLYAPREVCFSRGSDPLDDLLEDMEVKMVIGVMKSRGLILFEPERENIEVVYNRNSGNVFLTVNVGGESYTILCPNDN